MQRKRNANKVYFGFFGSLAFVKKVYPVQWPSENHEAEECEGLAVLKRELFQKSIPCLQRKKLYNNTYKLKDSLCAMFIDSWLRFGKANGI